MVVGTILFASIYDKSNRLRWSLSGSVSKESVKLGVGLGAASVVILANLPQVILWLNLVFLNRLVTCMAVSREWSLMAHARKGLRTSTSRGEQRSTYWLQLPLKFAIPMLAVSTGLHYLVSQALFFVSLRIYSPYDDESLIEDYTGLGYAQSPAHVLLITLLLLNSAIVLWGKSYNKPGIPQGGFNSAVLSAACHPPAGETDVHLKPVQWGMVSPPDEEAGVGHCSFSSEEVSLPVEGKKYA